MSTVQVNYECNELPEDASPVWTKTSLGSVFESVSGGILTITTESISQLSYLRNENDFKRGDFYIRFKRVSGSPNGNFVAGFWKSDLSQHIRVRIEYDLDQVSLRVGSEEEIIPLDVDQYHVYHVQFVTVGNGFPKAHLFVDGTLKATVTSNVAFSPGTANFKASSGGVATPQMSVDIDYVRYVIRGGGSRRRRGMDDTMLPDVKKPELLKKKAKKPKTMYITFPQDGGTESIDAGDLLLNFEDGTARLPDGTEKKLSDKLEGSGHEYMRAIFLDNPDAAIKFSLDDGGWFSVDANSFRGVILQPFKKCKIRTTAMTAIRIYASTDGRSGLVAA